jgi:hypothetical protein
MMSGVTVDDEAASSGTLITRRLPVDNWPP